MCLAVVWVSAQALVVVGAFVRAYVGRVCALSKS